ncbi:glycosyltransferase family 2 protein [Dyadobacter sp. CY343]|uniref:glycosyltransferase family 2 protein n=1 Tax=Dyadobacter sp. CY343 TaxID=2907299 RepID=UPI001F456CDF|nr:glycosyltransferase family 2 protein [Dyadobacter sp. CY343]MCE7060021.1 glycosyltransferase family 2 protein [Dyadobacter sp. CY343]
MNPLVSIIIPSYNYGFIIEETLRNLQEQSYTNWEALIVDDGSSDNTAEVVRKFVAQDSRIYFFTQKNKGVSVARNLGFAHSKGSYIQFLDADDLLSKDKLAVQVEYLETHPGTDISYTDHLYFEHDRPEIMYPDYEMNNHNWLPKIDAKGYDAINTLIYSNIAVVSSPMLRRAVVKKVKGFPEFSNYTEDWEFWFQCAIMGARYTFLDDDRAKTLIRIHQRNTSRNIQIMQAGELQFRKRIVAQLRDSQVLNAEEKEILLQRNAASTQKLYKYMMYHADLGSLPQLKILYNLVDRKTFISYYFKSLNFKRKELFKKKKR